MKNLQDQVNKQQKENLLLQDEIKYLKENYIFQNSTGENDNRNQSLIESIPVQVNYLDDKIQENDIPNFKKKLFSSLGWFAYTNTEWTDIIENDWKTIKFDRFEGDNNIKGCMSSIEIPEDGKYFLSSEYYWASGNGNIQVETAIAINSPSNISNDWHHHNLQYGSGIKSGIRRLTDLNKGDKVMLSVHSSKNSSIFLGHCELSVEKLGNQHSLNVGKLETIENNLNRLDLENINLNRTFNELKDNINPYNPLQAKLYSKNGRGWIPYSDTSCFYVESNWKAVIFNDFDGDNSFKGDNMHTLKIPENGMYKLSAEYFWASILSEDLTYVQPGISINTPGNQSTNFHQFYLRRDFSRAFKNGIRGQMRLNKGDLVMLSVISELAEPSLAIEHFELKVEKL